MYCKFCGKQLPDDSVFCGFCGKRLDAPVQPPAQPPQQEPEPVRLEKPADPAEIRREAGEPFYERQEDLPGGTDPSAGKAPPIWIFLVLLLVGVLAFGIYSQSGGSLILAGTKEDCIRRLEDSLSKVETMFDETGMDYKLMENGHTWKQEGCRFHFSGPVSVSLNGIEASAQLDADFVVTKESEKLIAAKIDGIPYFQYLDGNELWYPFLEDDDAVDAYFWKMTKDGTIDGEKIVFPDKKLFAKDWGMDQKLYSNLEIGMTYERVCTTLGREGKKEATLMSGNEVYRWGTDSKFAELVFYKGRLVTKRLEGFS